jgi:hypothetical protein
MQAATNWPDCSLARKLPFSNNRRKCHGETRIIIKAMVSSSQIKEHLALYLANRTSLGQFEDWFVPNTRDIRQTRSEAATVLTFGIEAALSEYLSQILDERELRHQLLQILEAENKLIEVADSPQVIYSFRSSSPSVFLPVKA